MGGLKRRDLIIGGGVVAAVGGAAAVEEGRSMKIAGQEATEDEKDLAKQVIAVFLGTFPAGGEPDPSQVSERAEAAVKAWRLLEKSG